MWGDDLEKYMGFLAVLAFIFSLGNSSKISRLKAEIKKVKRCSRHKMERGRKGEVQMSKILEQLVGKECCITLNNEEEENATGTFGKEMCTVLCVDEDWMKISYEDVKGKQHEKIVRIDDIANVEYEV